MKKYESVENIDEIIANIKTLNRYGEGSESEQKFHNTRIKNGKIFVALKTKDEYIFAPNKFVRYKSNSLHDYGNNQYTKINSTERDLSGLLGSQFELDDDGYTAIDDAYLKYCAAHGFEPSQRKDRDRRYWLVDLESLNHETKMNIADYADRLNELAVNYQIGTLQETRKKLKELRQISSLNLFSNKTIGDDWAFHHGGRKELQFNIGIEDTYLRHGVAISLQLSRDLPETAAMLPKIRLFNEYITTHANQYDDFLMCLYDSLGRSENYSVSAIPENHIQDGNFIFLGSRQFLNQINFKQILEDFDRLLPLYIYVESNGKTDVIEDKEHFVFRARHKVKRSRTIASQLAKDTQMVLLHNDMQQQLYEILVDKYGEHNVATEHTNGTGRQVDVIVQQKKAYWYYEIKTYEDPRLCLREAIGQLLEYCFWPSAQKAEKLIVVGKAPLNEGAKEYLSILRKETGLNLEYLAL